mmetsp:Transcript_30089/g.86643  ORF Transcript_30089/g.86643 Transcript_30089/m.86643 type:complete len:247 (+) Transcript_30089:1624-2364(+)
MDHAGLRGYKVAAKDALVDQLDELHDLLLQLFPLEGHGLHIRANERLRGKQEVAHFLHLAIEGLPNRPQLVVVQVFQLLGRASIQRVVDEDARAIEIVTQQFLQLVVHHSRSTFLGVAAPFPFFFRAPVVFPPREADDRVPEEILAEHLLKHRQHLFEMEVQTRLLTVEHDQERIDVPHFAHELVRQGCDVLGVTARGVSQARCVDAPHPVAGAAPLPDDDARLGGYRGESHIVDMERGAVASAAE